MLRVLYVTSSSFSGSTLLSFLLNVHPEIFTVGEMDGWNYGKNETFNCSCGESLSTCPFFRMIAETFHKHRLPFEERNFGTRHDLFKNDRLNRYLTASLPHFISTTSLERMRDVIVSCIPPFSKLLAQQDCANLTFIRAALSYSGARVFVDACKDPYRLRHLRRIHDLDLHVVYLIRDPRGVVWSNLKNRGWTDAALATRMWLHEQQTILRILNEFPSVLRVYYEDLCEMLDETLATVHRFVGLDPYIFPGDFKGTEHHILGNVMRLSNLSKVVKQTRWKEALSKRDLTVISRTALAFVKKNKHHPLSEIVIHYVH